eukprot:2750293-Ditylum_brightwellii.AAC.1
MSMYISIIIQTAIVVSMCCPKLLEGVGPQATIFLHPTKLPVIKDMLFQHVVAWAVWTHGILHIATTKKFCQVAITHLHPLLK